MAEPRKVAFVTLSASTAAAAVSSPGSEAKKRRLDADTKPSESRESELAAPEAAGSGKSPGHSESVRINITLAESTELSFPEFSYCELLQAQKRPPGGSQTRQPFNDGQRHAQEVEALARKFNNKYGLGCRRKREDRLQDLIDIGFGYDESDSFIDNSEAYDELVPASINTKLGGFYINTGTLQFRTASDSESNGMERPDNGRGGEESEVKKRGRDEEEPKETMTSNHLTKTDVCGRERKTRRLMLASMLNRLSRETEDMRKTDVNHSTQLLHTDTLLAHVMPNPAPQLEPRPNGLEFGTLDPDPQKGSKNELMCAGAGLRPVDGACMPQVAELPALPGSLPAPLVKRIEDLRAASRQFDEEGRKKFFTLDMNNILLDIELQVQEQSPPVQAAVYSHLESFVPCSKEALLKRLKKLSLNIQDDRLRTPLLKLKLAVCSVMPEQTDRYNMAKGAAKQQMEDGERNGSEDEEEEKPGKRVTGPRKKFIWDDKLRTLLCNLVRLKLICYDQEKSSLSVEDYLKAFMENEVKPLWPKGWMQARMLLKESRTVHGHLTELVKKRIMSTPKAAKIKKPGWQLGPVPGLGPAPFLSHPPSEPICLSDSLDDDLATNSLDSIARALDLLNSTNGVHSDSAPSTSSSSPVVAKPHTAGPTTSLQSSMLKDVSSVLRHTHNSASKPSFTSTTATTSAKPRPPPTTTPLQKPFGAIGIKSGQATPPLNKLCDGVVQQPSLNSSNSKSLQQLTTPTSPSLPFIQKKTTPTGQHQRFITPMQATITKSSQTCNSPIIKLTHRPAAQTTPSAPSHRPAAQTTPSAPSHRPAAQTTPSAPSHRPAAQTTPSGPSHRPSAQTTLSGPSHCPSTQTTNSGPSHRPSAQTTPSGPSAQTTPSGPSHRPSAQTTLSGPSPCPSAQTTPSGLSHCPAAHSTPSGSSPRPAAHSTPSGPSHRLAAHSTPSGPSHCSSAQTTPSGPAHRLSAQTTPSGSSPLLSAQTIHSGPSHRPSAQTTPFGPFHHPAAQTTPSGPSNRSSAQTTPSGPSNRSSAQTTPSGPSNRPAAQTTPSGASYRPFAQTTTSRPSHQPSLQATPPASAHRSPVQARPPASVHQLSAHFVPPGSTHHSSVSTPSPPSTANQQAITTPSSGQSNRPPALNSQNMGAAHRIPASTLPTSFSTHRPLVSTPPSPSSQRSSVQTPPSSNYRPSVSTPPPNHAHRSPVATPPSITSPTTTPPTQYNPRSSGFKPTLSTAPVATPHTSSFQDSNLTSVSVSTDHGQRQRAVGGANQSNKSSASCRQLSPGRLSLSDSALLNQVSSVQLGLGMFRDLVPVQLLNFIPPSAATPVPSSGFTLTPNLFKSLQSGVAAALPPHLQIAFSESNQSQAGDVKRK